MSGTPGERLTRLLADLGITQADAAQRIGVTGATISRICSGAGEMTARVAERLGAALGVRPCWLLFGEGDREPTPGDAYLAGMAAAYREIARVAASLAGGLG